VKEEVEKYIKNNFEKKYGKWHNKNNFEKKYGK
jgi:hypothetical protein